MQPGCVHVAVPVDTSQALAKANGNGHHAPASAEELRPLGGRPAGGRGAPTGGWACVPDRVLTAQHPGLSTRARVLYMLLVAHKHRTTGQCNPSQETLGRLLGCSPDRVAADLAVLAGLRWIDIAHVPYQSNQYALLLPTKRPFIKIAVKVLKDETLPVAARLAYAALARRQRFDERTCKATVADLARDVGLKVSNGKCTVMEDGLRALGKAGYLGEIRPHGRKAAERHVTLLDHEPPRRQKGAEPSVNHAPANDANPRQVRHDDSSNPRQMRHDNPRQVRHKPDVFNQIPSPARLTASLEDDVPQPDVNHIPLCERAAPQAQEDAPKARHDARSASSGARQRISLSPQETASQAEGTLSFKEGEGQQQRGFYHNHEWGISLASPAEIHGPQPIAAAPAPAEGPPSPAPAPRAAGPARTPKPKRVPLRPFPELPERDPEGRLGYPDWLQQARWAAHVLLAEAYGARGAQPKTIAAYEDICLLLFINLGADAARYLAFCRYLGADLFFKSRGRDPKTGRPAPIASWDEQPQRLLDELFHWLRLDAEDQEARQPGWLPEEGTVSVYGCYGCLKAGAPRWPAKGAEHMPDCVYREDGVIGQDHWSPARWARARMEQGEGERS